MRAPGLDVSTPWPSKTSPSTADPVRSPLAAFDELAAARTCADTFAAVTSPPKSDSDCTSLEDSAVALVWSTFADALAVNAPLTTPQSGGEFAVTGLPGYRDPDCEGAGGGARGRALRAGAHGAGDQQNDESPDDGQEHAHEGVKYAASAGAQGHFA